MTEYKQNRVKKLKFTDDIYKGNEKKKGESTNKKYKEKERIMKNLMVIFLDD